MNALLLPDADVVVRPASLADLVDVDRLQRAHSRELGFLHRATLEGKVRLGQMLVAHTAGGAFAGYVVGSNTYHKREEVGVVYQMAVEPRLRRGNVAAVLLRALFASWPYGTRLCCAWCAQDLAANRFWEAMGFVPLAYRAGSAGKGRVHIFWQRRVVEEDEKTPWWYPSITGSGAIREDRLVLPIPEGQHWGETRPTVLPGIEERGQESQTTTDPVVPVPALPKGVEHRDGQFYLGRKRLMTAEMIREAQGAGRGGLFMVPMDVKLVKALPVLPVKAKRKTVKKPKAKHDPRMASAVRELRDRWLEHVNAGGLLLSAEGKYAVGRTKTLPAESGDRLVLPMPIAPGRRLLPAA